LFWVVVCHHENFDNRNCKPFKNSNIIGGAINSKNPNPTINDADITPIIYPKLDKGVTIKSINQRRYIKPIYISCSSSSSIRVPNFAKSAPIKGTKIIKGGPTNFINKAPIKEIALYTLPPIKLAKPTINKNIIIAIPIVKRLSDKFSSSSFGLDFLLQEFLNQDLFLLEPSLDLSIMDFKPL
jgi:hypothetical protein